MALKEGELTKRYYNDFSSGVNTYFSDNQIKDSESPNATDCDFKGLRGVGNREGYTEIGAVADSRTEIYGMATFHTSAKNQLIKFADNGSNVALYYSTGAAWTAVTGTTFTKDIDIDVCQAGGKLFSGNGTDQMVKYDGTSWAAHTGATKGFYPTYYNKRLWVVDETNLDTLNFSTQYPDATKELDFDTNGTSSNPGTITFNPGSGEEIRGMKAFKDKLYVFLTNSIYRIYPASAANTFTAELVTKSIGCVSYRSIDQSGEDLYFAADDGVYSLGDVANYVEVRTTNKSGRLQNIYDAISGAKKRKLVGVAHNFKYHLFYSRYGTSNESCLVYDVRYQSWQDWRNIPANSAVVYTNSSSEKGLYFGEPTTGKVNQLYSGTTDDGTAITSIWYSKMFDYDVPDITKLFMESTFVFGAMNGTIRIDVLFEDGTIGASVTLTQGKPQGGIGSSAFGVKVFGAEDNSVTVTQLVNKPYRVKAKGQKFAIQYRISSSGSWKLTSISQTFIPFGHYKFPSINKLN